MKYKTLVALRNVSDSAVSLASRLATKASNAAHTADVKAKTVREEANRKALNAASRRANEARDALTAQTAAFKAEQAAIKEAHPFV